MAYPATHKYPATPAYYEAHDGDGGASPVLKFFALLSGIAVGLMIPLLVWPGRLARPPRARPSTCARARS